MPRRLCLVLACFLLHLTGCGGGERYRIGREAEKRGDASKAYDEYRGDAVKHHGSGAVAAALERIVPAAAAESESAALTAMDQGRHADAWRLFMRTLEIQPNHPDAPQLIRRLETDHSAEIAEARAEWLRRGWTALAYRPAEPPETVAPVPEITLAQRENTSNPGLPHGDSLATIRQTTNQPTQSDSDPSSPPPASNDASAQSTNRIYAAPPPADSALDPVPTLTDNASPPSAPGSAGGLDADVGPAAPPADSMPKKPAPLKPTARPGGEYLVVHTVSERDRRYPRIVLAVDGIKMEIRDTDDDLEVDLDLFDGDRRIKKIRDLPLGGSQTFRGRSGVLYRLTVLAIHHKSHTARIGIKPA